MSFQHFLPSSPPRLWTDDRGYTLLSALFTIAIVSITAVIGLTAYSHQADAARLSAAEHQLTSLVQQGLSHARQRETSLVLSDNQLPEGFSNWQQGITLRSSLRGAPLITRHWPPGITIIGPAHRLFIMPRAFDSALTATFVLCTSSGQGRKVIFNRAGSMHHEEASEQDCQRR